MICGHSVGSTTKSRPLLAVRSYSAFTAKFRMRPHPNDSIGGVQSANIAQFGIYVAASFVTAAGRQGGTVFSETAERANQQPLAHPSA